MDLREIQALHAQYATDAGVIDLAGEFARIPPPLLSAPSVAKRTSSQPFLSWTLKTGLVAISATVFAYGGMQAANLWHTAERHHAGASAVPSTAVPVAAKVVAKPGSTANPTPAPLTAADFGGQPQTEGIQAPTADAMAHISAAELLPEHHQRDTVALQKKPDDAPMSAPIVPRVATNTTEARIDVPAPAASLPVEAHAARPEGAPTEVRRTWRERRIHPQPASAQRPSESPTATTTLQHAKSGASVARAGGDVSIF